jgi:hypothetical protein
MSKQITLGLLHTQLAPTPLELSLAQPKQSALTLPMLMACTICMAMFGNGAAIF